MKNDIEMHTVLNSHTCSAIHDMCKQEFWIMSPICTPKYR